MSRVTKVTNDNNHFSTVEYDGVNRAIHSTDPLNNETLTVYDPNGNVTQTTSQQRRGDDLTAAPEIFVAKTRYDSLNRPILSVDNANQARRMAYDSRGNVTQVSDAQGPVNVTDPQFGLINGSGNTTRYFYDGLNRKTKTIQDIRVGGIGNGTPTLDGPTDPNTDPATGTNPGDRDISNTDNPDGLITETSVWDDNSRLQSVADDKGNSTSYQYDSLNRKTLDTFADTTTNSYVYDLDSNLKQLTDENGNVFTYTYDAANRKTQTSITRGTGINGTTVQTFEYDGFGRPTKLTDNNNPAVSTDDSLVTFAYDSLSRKLEENQDGNVVSSDYDGVGNRTQLTYPNNRVLTQTYDSLERLKTIHETAGNIASYSYIGSGRVLERTFLNATKLTYLDNTGADVGYDSLQRIVDHRYETAADSTITDFTYGFNRENDRLFEKRLHQPAGPDTKGEAYTYDSQYRLTNFQVGTQNASGVVTTLDTQTAYTLDGVGNRTSINKDATVTSYAPNNMNEYNTVGGVTHLYDDKGNLKDDNNNLYFHDALNRLIEVKHKSDGSALASYTYDALNRRVTKAVTTASLVAAQTTAKKKTSSARLAPTSVTTTTRYLLDGSQEVEERDAGGTGLAQYVYGSAIDEILAMDRGGQRYYYHDDSLGSPEALTNSSGNVVERMTFDAYGAPQFTNAAFTPTGTTSSVGNPFLYTAQRLDPETGLYYYRNRYYSPSLGRFIERDPVGYSAGSMGLYEYVGGNMINMTDPMGLDHTSVITIESTSGKETKLNTPSGAEVKKALGDMAAQGEKLKKLDVNGHGTEGTMDINDHEYLHVKDGKVFIGDDRDTSEKGDEKTDITGEMKTVCGGGSSVDLRGCNTAHENDGEKSIAEKLSEVLPGTEVTGSRRWMSGFAGFLGLNWTLARIPKTFYTAPKKSSVNDNSVPGYDDLPFAGDNIDTDRNRVDRKNQEARKAHGPVPGTGQGATSPSPWDIIYAKTAAQGAAYGGNKGMTAQPVLGTYGEDMVPYSGVGYTSASEGGRGQIAGPNHTIINRPPSKN